MSHTLIISLKRVPNLQTRLLLFSLGKLMLLELFFQLGGLTEARVGHHSQLLFWLNALWSFMFCLKLEYAIMLSCFFVVEFAFVEKHIER
jgi:hypothetical protein